MNKFLALLSHPNNTNMNHISMVHMTSTFCEIKTNYTANRIVLVSASGDHGKLVKAGEKEFRTLPISSNPTPISHKAHPKPDFVGSEVHVHDDDIPNFRWHISLIVVKGVTWSSPAPQTCPARMKGRLVRNERMGEGNRRGRQRLMLIVGG